MTRAYHSASSISLGIRCQRAWAYQYLDGLRDVEIAWSDIERGAPCTSRQKALALGKAYHAAAESYYRDGAIDTLSLPGRMLSRAVVHLPAYGTHVEVEQAIGTPSSVHACGRALMFHGIAWVGMRDLLDVLSARQIDHKTCGDPRYALTTDGLAHDLQCALYTVDACTRFGVDHFASRWVYALKRPPHTAWPVDATVTFSDAYAIVQHAADVARVLDSIESSAAAEPNPAACGAYGGCQYHVTAGGPCNVTRAPSALLTTRGITNMALSDELKAKFSAVKSPAEPAAPAAPAAPARAGSAPADESSVPPASRARNASSLTRWAPSSCR